MWLDLGNVHTQLTRSTPAEEVWLREYMTYRNPDARFNSKAPKEKSLFNLLNRSFPTGFVSLVQKAAAEDGIEVQVFDRRLPPVTRDPNADLAWLRDYQLGAVDAVVARHRGILWLPTGSGKTEIAVGLTRALPCRWLFLVHSAGLMQDAADRYDLRGAGAYDPAGRIGDACWQYDDMFTAATFATVIAALKGDPARRRAMEKVLAATEGVIIDEAHTLPADTHWLVAMLLDNAYYRVGMSGTPLARGDRKSLLAICATGPVIYRVKTDVLTQAGAVSSGKVTMVECDQPPSSAGTYQGVYGDRVVRSAQRNGLLVDLAHLAAKPALLFVKEIRHGRELERRLLKSGIAAGFVWGTHSTEYRRDRVRDLVAGRYEVLVCSAVFQEGVDIPSLASVVVGVGGASGIAALQRIGRAMRPDAASGKTGFEVWDVYDKGDKWLEKHSRARLRAYTSEGHNTVVLPTPPMAPTPALPIKGLTVETVLG